MPHVLEPASTGRAKCRGCGQAIARGELRLGERFENSFGEGEMTIWFHPLCAAYKRPASLLEALQQTAENVPDRDALERAANGSTTFPRLTRIDGAERSPSGQAKCRLCHQLIARDVWRVRLVFFEQGVFSPGGFVHLDCRNAYFETADILAPLLHFSPKLSEEDREELTRACAAASIAPSPASDPS